MVLRFHLSNLKNESSIQILNHQLVIIATSYSFMSSLFTIISFFYIEQWPDFGCEGIKVQRAHQPTSQCQGKKKITCFASLTYQLSYLDSFVSVLHLFFQAHIKKSF
eukprot:TRINITY_DN903_c0_g1_i5.p5 TRINITY_DN903_c0_g1~~TRINITY_DN903_c0_g1_i5.p5  ORF type:complete len:107 (-),score=2.91 TRINITY_DN903_c0_g1_i5:715-1035(-)